MHPLSSFEPTHKTTQTYDETLQAYSENHVAYDNVHGLPAGIGRHDTSTSPAHALAVKRMQLRTVSPMTVIVLIVAASIVVWANLQTSKGWHDFGARAGAPPELDPVTRYYFSRGWPVAPWWVCIYYGNRFHPEESPVRLVPVVNGVVAFLLLAGTAALSEWFTRRVRRWAGPPQGDHAPPH